LGWIADVEQTKKLEEGLRYADDKIVVALVVAVWTPTYM
jgi:hypothetical protein